MSLYELVNPSDAYTFHAPDDATAFVVAIALGEGKYGAVGPSGKSLGLLMFADSAAVTKELVDRLGTSDLTAYMVAHRLVLADALDSVMIGERGERERVEALLAAVPVERRAVEREAYHHKRRSSMNDIGGRAWRQATALRNLKEG